MATKRVKVKEYENLSDSNILKVVQLLEAEKPITKKEACEILNISYNTTRLSNIVEGYKAKIERDKKLRSANRGKPLSDHEIKETVLRYLQGEPLTEISKSLFRPAKPLKDLVTRLGVPTKPPYEQRVRPSVIPEQCVSEIFNEGQRAWSAVYHASCTIVKEVLNKPYNDEYSSRCYQIYVDEPFIEEVPGFEGKVGGFYAYSLAYNLGSLEHLKELGVTL